MGVQTPLIGRRAGPTGTEGLEMSDLHYSGQEWIAEALALQEEHLKRIRGCEGRPVKHRYETHRHAGSTRGDAMWQACAVCKVTASEADWRIMMGG